ncbi:fimbrial protein [[Enterobacter] lignolyticus]|uniref:Ferrous iron transporter B n=1 Tax=[Enterobacter] lignolyticus TaxID=1334193 RepID=A0A806X410_9ENTR|nr:ferrous iron transporter B [[Enterobacter] lignolyticus]
MNILRNMLTVCTLLLCASASAIDVQMTGNIYANTCAVDGASQSLTVDLGQDSASNFSSIGDTGEWKDFDLTLSQCPATVTLATAQFKGQADGKHPNKFANTGTAGGLALELADRQDKILLAPQANFSVLVNQSDHTADFPLSARYYATSEPVTAGTFSATVQVTFTYQ